jgi:hypothetical protein
LCKCNLHVTLNICSYGPKGSAIIQAVCWSFESRMI